MRLPFDYQQIDVGDVRVNCAIGGVGPPVLLLHGYPQTHIIWHHVAPILANDFTVIATDLRGYGDSSKPVPSPSNVEYSKRAMADDQLGVMRQLGFSEFHVAGHDRGGRVGHRLALDHPEAVKALAVLDIVPTRYTFEHADKQFGLGYFHWFFLAAGNGIPERLIGQDPEFWIKARMTSRHGGGTPFEPAAIDEYVRCFSDPAAISASCADYRAAATIDLEHDASGGTVSMPLLALWGEHSFVGQTYDVLAVWRSYADRVEGMALPSNHYLPEEAPQETAAALQKFFTS
ncbi:alpha/beta hydrolase [Kibdelosporangium philippinense]|uniref:Alpha/beta hydrolase n=1 Tax=Kibdelosporangium philippinense TaxID=211113 RepID=A0ABS8Z4E0_9PSEU|nr:alpha/beta hydrolase [Kibdelosporangium philippinense]MCE7002700.1 alpha/beta hydrolase [Kibdelosporangium philippinense]